MKTIHLRISEELYQKIKDRAERKEQTATAEIRRALVEEFAESSGEKGTGG